MKKITASVSPSDSLQVLSRREINMLYDASRSDFYEMFRRCALAVLTCGSTHDDTSEVLAEYADFDINVVLRSRGVKLELINAPAEAFVDGVMIKGIKAHLFSVLRDVVFVGAEIYRDASYDLNSSEGITDAVFSILRHAGMLVPDKRPNMVVCWGGHSIGRDEYDYTKSVGYELGLRYLDICTGCGPGAMKGPMKGAAIGHAKQHFHKGRYIGISEPGIIAAESPNPIVNQLIIMPDIEKRLEAFVRTAHGIVVFPGGVGTAEEILYLLGILMLPENRDADFPLLFSAPKASAGYFEQIDQFIRFALGDEAAQYYEIVVDDPRLVAQRMADRFKRVQAKRRENKDAYYFNWSLHIDSDFQRPFHPTHENMANLNLHRDQPAYQLAANLRCVFSGLVAGNVKLEGQQAVAKYGKYKINGDTELMRALDALLISFAEQGRMKIHAESYKQCYEIVDS
ncbi:LOG family protein [bacterium]|nr:LOG family protein [bacterium]